MTVQEKAADNSYFIFEFSVKGIKMYQRIFDASCFNHATRYSVYIADIYKNMQKDLIHILVFNNKNVNLNLYGYGNSSYKSKNIFSKLSTLSNNDFFSENAFEFKLYINDNIIIGRNFTLFQKDNIPFSVNTLCSTEFYDILDYYCHLIQNYIKEKDKEQMWQEYYLLKYHNIAPKDARELSLDKRKKLLHQCNYY